MTSKRADSPALLTPEEMAEADRLTIASGTEGRTLMQRAGRAVADTVLTRFPHKRRIALLAGPGNNGNDAYVAASLLAEAGCAVTVFAPFDLATLEDDAANAAKAYLGPLAPLSDFDPGAFDLVVDGLFGAGLARPIDGEIATVIERVNASALPVVAIDLPSGVCGLGGAVLGTAFRADATVTFFRRKPGHLLQPGREHCGEVVVAGIGIAASVLGTIKPRHFANEPALWASHLKVPSIGGHKFDRGHAVVFSGGATQTGAARLAARAALRGGAGLVTMLAAGSALMVNAAHLTAVMLRRCDGSDDLSELLKDERLNAFVLGPGFGIGETARTYALSIFANGRRLVLDADGISAFQDDPEPLFVAANAAREPALVLTPHIGEFARLFPDLAASEEFSKVARTRAAAARAGAIVVLKGSDTVIAAPDGRAAINANGTPWLATAGSGDVLAGLVAAQLAHGMPSFEAACAAVWMHARAAELFGPGLIAEDLPETMPLVLAELSDRSR